MAGDFFPRREGELVHWSAGLSRILLEDGEHYAVPPEQAESLALAQAAFAESLRRANDPTTATTPVVHEKNRAKKRLIAELRLVNRRVGSAMGRSKERIVSLGLNPRGRGGRQTRLPEPDSSPLLTVEKVEGRTAHVRLSRKSGGNPNARPKGVQFAQVFRCVGPEPATRKSGWNLAKVTNRRRFAIDFPDDLAPGTQVWLYARWVTASGLVGRGSAAVTVNLPGGSTLLKPKQLRAA